MLHYDGYNAWISVGEDEIELPQYGVSTDETQVSCWIESKAGQKFSVRWNNLDQAQLPTAGLVIVDGVSAGGRFLRSGTTACLERIIASPTSTRRIMFSTLNLTDDDTYLASESSKDIGEIRLTIWEVSDIASVPAPATKFVTESLDNKVHERAKKGLAHRVQFGDAEPSTLQLTSSCKYVRIIVTFIFKYRPLDILRAEGIVVTKPINTPDSSVDKSLPIEDELTAAGKRKFSQGSVKEESEDDEDETDEIKALEAKLKALREERGKRAKTKRVKVEFDSRPVFNSGEIIDLTYIIAFADTSRLLLN